MFNWVVTVNSRPFCMVLPRILLLEFDPADVAEFSAVAVAVADVLTIAIPTEPAKKLLEPASLLFLFNEIVQFFIVACCTPSVVLVLNNP